MKEIALTLLGAAVTLGLHAALTQIFERGHIKTDGVGAIIGIVRVNFGAYVLYAVFSERQK